MGHSFTSTVESVENADIESFIFIEPPIIENALYLVGQKKIYRSAEVINRFNRGLRIVKESGEYHQILRKYGLDNNF